MEIMNQICISRLDKMGDMILSLPAIKAIKMANPNTKIYILASTHNAKVLKQLKEKQKARAIYGILERQFRNYYRKANNMDGVTGDRLLQLLESRLDNIIYRLGFAISRSHARQIVAHGHIEVNGKKVSIPSYQVQKGDEIKWKDSSKNTTLFEIIKSAENVNVVVPRWLKSDTENGSGQVVAGPNISEIDTLIDTRQIIEYYSRR